MHGRGHIREYTLAIRFSFSETYPSPISGVLPASESPCKKLHDIAQIALMPVCDSTMGLKPGIMVESLGSECGITKLRGNKQNQ